MSRRSRSRSRIIDKWSAKDIYQVYTPPGFLEGEERLIGETVADDPQKMIGRVIEVSLGDDLINDYTKRHVKLQFQITDVTGNKAQTRFKGHSFARDHLRFLVRRRRTRIDSISTVKTKDGVLYRVTATGFTTHRSKASQKDAIRRQMMTIVEDRAAELDNDEFIREATNGKIGSLIYFQVKRLFPMRGVEIQKTKLLTPLDGSN